MMGKKSILYVLVLSLLASSCIDQKKFIYFQHKNADSLALITDSLQNYSPLFQADDILTITVSAIDPEAVRPFNIQFQQYENNNTSNRTSRNNSNGNSNGYLIDHDGNIEFPILGTLKIAGLTRVQATNLIKDKLKAYVKEPIVNIRLVNFRVTILGDVSVPGMYTISNERVTVPDALGLAGDITMTGLRENVVVIREYEGKKTETIIDLTSRDVFRSPVYYLRQNDIIYVQPSKYKMRTATNTVAYGSMAASGLSILISLINILTRK